MEKVEALLAQASALTLAEQHELLRQLHDAIYHPTYAPFLPPRRASGCPDTCAGSQ